MAIAPRKQDKQAFPFTDKQPVIITSLEMSGTIVRAGPEQSEIKCEDGKDRTVRNGDLRPADGVSTAHADKKKPTSWRDVLPVHPAADLFPMMSREELLALGNDIKKNGLKVPIILWAENLGGKCYLLDGRNRLDAMEAIGLGISFDDPLRGLPSKVLYAKELLGKIVDGTTLLAADPYSYVISANIHRRHLSAEDKRRLIGELLNADPSKSNRAIAETLKDDHKKVGRVRQHLETTGALPQLTKTTGKDGKERPAKRPIQPAAKPPASRPIEGVSQARPTPEKRTSGHPTGSPSAEKPATQTAVAKSDTQPICSFCQKNEEQISLLIRSGDGRAFICNECIDQGVLTVADPANRMAVARWDRNAKATHVAKMVLAILEYEMHTAADLEPLKAVLRQFIGIVPNADGLDIPAPLDRRVRP